MAEMAEGGQCPEPLKSLFDIDAHIHVPHLVAVPRIGTALPEFDQNCSSGQPSTVRRGSRARASAQLLPEGSVGAVPAYAAGLDNGLAHPEASRLCFGAQRFIRGHCMQLFSRAAFLADQKNR